MPCFMRMTRTLDSIVTEHGLPLPDLIKIDVQGAEIDILKGAAATIQNCERLIVELQCVQYNRGALLVNESLPIIEGMGFECVDPLFCNNGPDGDYGFRNRR
ncbi:FkbM family methyltransferase [bacterium]|nr:FkbM family methyltransferase [bacterium]